MSKKLTLKQSNAARFLIGVVWGLIYSDGIVNAREAPGLMVFMTIATLLLGLVAALEGGNAQ